MSQLTVNTVFAAIDKFTNPVKIMEKAATKFGQKLDTATAMAERGFRRVKNSADELMRSSLTMGLSIAAPLVYATKQAIDFEDKMADVAKVANVSLGSKEFEKLADNAKNLSKYLGVTSEDAAGLLASLAQGGVAIKDLEKVAQISGRVGVAFGITSEMAGEYFIKSKNALGGNIQQTEELMNSINMLGNMYAAKSSEILTFMASGGSAVARAADADGKALAAFGTQFISMGKSAEESATIMERFIKTTLKTSSLKSVFDKAGGGANGMLAVIEKGSKLSGNAQNAYFAQFGEYGLSLQLLGKNFTDLQDKVKNATNEQMISGSVMSEFQNRTQTTAFKLAQLKAEFTVLAIEVGQQMIPILTDLINTVKPYIQQVLNWIKNNRETTSTIIKVTAALAGLSFAVSGISFLVKGFTSVIWLMKGALFALKGIIWLVEAAQWAWNIALTMNPIGAIIMLVVALIAAIISIIYYWDEWGRAFVAFSGPVGLIITLFQELYENWDMIKKAFEMDGILGGFKALGQVILSGLLYPLQKVLEIVGYLPDWLGGGLATDGAKAIADFRADLTSFEQYQPKPEVINMNNERTRNFVETINNNERQQLDVNFNNMPNGATVQSSGANFVMPKLTPSFNF
jgi:TP901 family phage tail tape measure protein